MGLFSWILPSLWLLWSFAFLGCPFSVIQWESWRFTIPYVSLIACVWDKWGLRKEKRNTWGSPHPLGITVLSVGEECSLHSVLKPLQILFTLMSLQPPEDCLGFEVWETREEGVKKDWGIYTLSEHTSFFFSENERASPVALSVLPAHLCVSGCIAFS